jgi:hypothetical protein
MDECSIYHDECPQNQISVLPSRIINVSGDKVKLHHSQGIMGTYLTLSHCWGSINNRIVTTLENLKDYQQGIEWGSLDRTYRDAITVTRRLGFKFLWIDSLCIVQDDPSDWEVESGRMAQIYENSFLTICATHAKNGNSGLFNDRHALSRLSENIDLISPWLADKKSGIYARLYPGYQFKEVGKSTARLAPLLGRAWALQERVLAARTIDYMCDEIMWECRTRRRCECLEEDRNYRLLGIQKARFNRFAILPADTQYVSSIPGYEPWEDVVRVYSGLDLSLPSDKLPALSGLAQKMARYKNGRYLAGIWEGDLPLNLLWYVGNRSVRHGNIFDSLDSWRLGTRPATYRAPTWSWASLDGNIYSCNRYTVDDEDERIVLASVVDVSYAPSSTDPFGHCASGSITLSAPLVPTQLRMLDNNGVDALYYELGSRSRTFCPDTNISDPRSSEFLPLDTPTFCLEILRSEWGVYGIVLKKESESRRYKRIGMFLELWGSICNIHASDSPQVVTIE